MGEDYYKCCAKIALNTLAHLRGQELVLQECFNPLRNWIVQGGVNRFVKPAPGHNADLKHLFPEDSHHVLISKAGTRVSLEQEQKTPLRNLSQVLSPNSRSMQRDIAPQPDGLVQQG